jgi:predicted GNAT family N-acyltransferase
MDIKVFYQLPEDAANIRVEVFVDEQGFSEEFDSDDKNAIHFVGYVDGKAVATSRVLTLGDNKYLIGRIAVIKVFRGKGFGSLIVKVAEEHIKRIGGKAILIHSQLQAADFYEKLGYVKTGETDIEEGCPHCMMLKQI